MTAAELAYKTSAANASDGDDLVMQELPQVYYIAARIRERLPQHVEMEDLVSAGVIGLIEATRSFDGSKNVQFKTFAKFRIRGAILDSLRETDWGSRYMRRQRARDRGGDCAAGEQAGPASRLKPRLPQEMQLDPEHLRRLIAQIDSLQLSGQKVAVSNDHSESLDVIESAPNLDDPDPFDLCLEGEMKDSSCGGDLEVERTRAVDLVSLLPRRAHDEGNCKSCRRCAFAGLADSAGNDGQTEGSPRTLAAQAAACDAIGRGVPRTCLIRTPTHWPKRSRSPQTRRLRQNSARCTAAISVPQAASPTRMRVRSDAIHETFAFHLSGALDTYLGTGVEVKLEALDQLPIKEHIAEIPPLCYIAPFSSNTMILELDNELVFPMIELLMGGTGSENGTARDLSEIEGEVMQDVVALLRAPGHECVEDSQPCFGAGAAHQAGLDASVVRAE